MADLALVMELMGRDAGASRAVREVSSSLDGLASTAGKTNAVLAVTAGVLAPIAIAAGAATAAVVALGSAFNAQKEQAQIAFTTMMGSADAAKQHLKDLQDFARTTPFELPQITAASQKLQAMGFNAGLVIPMLTTIGNAAAGLNLGTEGINRITIALGQMQAKGKATGEEFMQLTEAGIPAWQALARAMGTDVATAMQKVTDGAVSSDFAIAAVLTGMDQRFSGLMEQQSRSMLGLLSTVKDTVSQFAGALAGPIFDRARDQLQSFVDLIGSDQATKNIEQMATRFGGLLDNVGGILGRLKDIAGRALGGDLQGATAQLEDTLGQWRDQFSAWVPGAWEETKRKLDILANNFGDFIKREGPPLAEKVTREWVPNFTNWVQIEATPALIRELDQMLQRLGTWVKNDGASAFKEAGVELWKALMGGITASATNLTAAIMRGLAEVASAGGRLNVPWDPRSVGERNGPGYVYPPSNAPVGWQGTGTPPTNTIDTSSPSAFLQSVMPYAHQVETETGIPASIMAAIAANETGYGRFAGGNNFFGIKGANPDTGASFSSPTWEVVNGQRVNIVDTFRAYDSALGSFRDFARFLADNSRYAGALQQRGDPEAFIRAIQGAGYATDPQWANKVLAIARNANLPLGGGSPTGAPAPAGTPTPGGATDWFAALPGGNPPGKVPDTALRGFDQAMAILLRNESYITAAGNPAASVSSALADAVAEGAKGEQGARVVEEYNKLITALEKSGEPGWRELANIGLGAIRSAFEHPGQDTLDAAIGFFDEMGHVLADRAAEMGNLTASRFMRSFQRFNVQAQIGSEGFGVLEALHRSIFEGSQQNVDALGGSAAAMVRSIWSKAPGDLGEEAIDQFMTALTRATEEKTPEAVQAFQEVVRNINQGLPLAKLGKDIGDRVNVAIQNTAEQITQTYQRAEEQIDRMQSDFARNRARQAAQDILSTGESSDMERLQRWMRGDQEGTTESRYQRDLGTREGDYRADRDAQRAKQLEDLRTQGQSRLAHLGTAPTFGISGDTAGDSAMAALKKQWTEEDARHATEEMRRKRDHDQQIADHNDDLTIQGRNEGLINDLRKFYKDQQKALSDRYAQEDLDRAITDARTAAQARVDSLNQALEQLRNSEQARFDEAVANQEKLNEITDKWFKGARADIDYINEHLPSAADSTAGAKTPDPSKDAGSPDATGQDEGGGPFTTTSARPLINVNVGTLVGGESGAREFAGHLARFISGDVQIVQMAGATQ